MGTKADVQLNKDFYADVLEGLIIRGDVVGRYEVLT